MRGAASRRSSVERSLCRARHVASSFGRLPFGSAASFRGGDVTPPAPLAGKPTA